MATKKVVLAARPCCGRSVPSLESVVHTRSTDDVDVVFLLSQSGLVVEVKLLVHGSEQVENSLVRAEARTPCTCEECNRHGELNQIDGGQQQQAMVTLLSGLRRIVQGTR